MYYTLVHAPGCRASRAQPLHWAWASHQVVRLLVLLLDRGEAPHPCPFLPTTAALDDAHPPAQQPRIANNQPTKKGTQKKKLDGPLASLALCPGPIQLLHGLAR